MSFLPLLGMWTPGAMELAIIAVIMLLLFGRRLPEIMRSLGGSIREFRKGMDTDDDRQPGPHSADAGKQVPGTAARDDAVDDAAEQPNTDQTPPVSDHEGERRL